MKAIIWTKYGPPDVLQLQEIDTPVPKENEILIKVHAATASTADTEIRRLKLTSFISILIRLYLGVRKPTRVTIPGTEFAGEIISIGNAVTLYQPGDQVFGYTGMGMGTCAEYLCLAEKPTALASVIAKKPVNISFEQAAALPLGGIEGSACDYPGKHTGRSKSADRWRWREHRDGCGTACQAPRGRSDRRG